MNLFTLGEIACQARRPCHTSISQQMAAYEHQKQLGAHTLNSRFLPIKSKITRGTKSRSAYSQCRLVFVRKRLHGGGELLC